MKTLKITQKLEYLCPETCTARNTKEVLQDKGK